MKPTKKSYANAEFYHWYIVSSLKGELIWEGPNLENCPNLEIPAPWRSGIFSEKKNLDEFYVLKGSPEGITFRRLPIDLIQKIKSRKKE